VDDRGVEAVPGEILSEVVFDDIFSSTENGKDEDEAVGISGTIVVVDGRFANGGIDRNPLESKAG